MFEIPDREDVREIVITAESILDGTPPLVVTEPQARSKREA
jgi:ATP-dependent protease Clp ATPase subunit